MTVVPIILAAGASPGLGFPKALARFGDRTALEIALANCAGLAPAIVVLGSRARQVRAAVPPGARAVVNEKWRAGQLSSLLAGLTRAPRSADFMLYPVDYPLLTPAIVSRLVAGFADRQPQERIAAPRFRRRAGHPVIFAAALRDELACAASAREVVYRDPTRVKFVSIRSEAIWRDLDSPAAYRAGQKAFAGTRRAAAVGSR